MHERNPDDFQLWSRGLTSQRFLDLLRTPAIQLQMDPGSTHFLEIYTEVVDPITSGPEVRSKVRLQRV